ncbi:MAG: hypothetical protein V4539_23860 [Bacteroidota bacterium]
MNLALRINAILYPGVMPVCLHVLQQVKLLLSTFTISFFIPLIILPGNGNAPNVAIPVFAINDTHSNFYKSIA